MECCQKVLSSHQTIARHESLYQAAALSYTTLDLRSLLYGPNWMGMSGCDVLELLTSGQETAAIEVHARICLCNLFDMAPRFRIPPPEHPNNPVGHWKPYYLDPDFRCDATKSSFLRAPGATTPCCCCCCCRRNNTQCASCNGNKSSQPPAPTPPPPHANDITHVRNTPRVHM